MRIAGIDVSGNDGRALVDLLNRVGRDADLALLHRIERGYSRQNTSIELSAAERHHLLGVLDDPPTPGLAELRHSLAVELHERDG